MMIISEKILLAVVILQSIELLFIRDHFALNGVWREPDLSHLLKDWTRRFVLSAQSFNSLLIGRIVIVLWALIHPEPQLFLFIFASQLLIVMRFRGPFNGGSDYLTTLSLGLLWIYHSFPNAPAVQVGCVLYLGLQIVLSYFLSGLSKLKVPAWRNGKALGLFLSLSKYQIPESWKRRAVEKSPLLQTGTFAILFYELSFPVVLIDPRLCLIWMTAGVLFHWLNYRIFGLNRFFWIWLACYPALYETSLWLSSQL